MKYFFGTLFIIYLIMCLGNFNDPPMKPPPEPTLKPWSNPEPGRLVDHYDENKMQYVYSDQVKKDSGVYRWKTPPMPDSYVQVIDQSQQQYVYVPQGRKYRRPRVVQDELKINGQRYRIYHKADHTQELIKIR